MSTESEIILSTVIHETRDLCDSVTIVHFLAEGTIVAFSVVPSFEVRFTTEQENGTTLNLVVRIRDQLGSVTNYNLSSIFIQPDLVGWNDFISSVTNSSANPFAELLNSGNQNQVTQVISGLAQQFNRIDRLFSKKAKPSHEASHRSDSFQPLFFTSMFRLLRWAH